VTKVVPCLGITEEAGDIDQDRVEQRGELVAVQGEPDSPGALVTPIITADGCVGVLAAELPNGRERREDVRALATIFSAQLATVVTPVAEVGQAGLVDHVAT